MAASEGSEKNVWHTDRSFAQMDMRVDLARMEVYRLLIQARADNDVYFEEIFNVFLALVQVPLNFAVYENNEFLFHLVNDPKYQSKFKTLLINNGKISKKAVPLFPQILGDRFKILIFELNTKNPSVEDWIETIHVDSDFEEQRDRQSEITSKSEYLQRATWGFFIAEWDGFKTRVQHKAAEAIKISINEMSRNYRFSSVQNKSRDKPSPQWPVSPELMESQLSPDNEYTTREQHRKWHARVSEIFERPLNDTTSGLAVQQLMMQENGGFDQENADILSDSSDENTTRPLPNMIMAYRSFDRHSIRSGWTNEENAGYAYNTRFLIRETGDNLSVLGFFQDLESLAQERGGLSKFTEARGKRFKRVLYRDIFSEAHSSKEQASYPHKNTNIALMRSIAFALDEKFWDLLKSADGKNRCLEILRSPVGDNARSFVDPVYHTGLIHFNRIFEFGGLDRVSTFLEVPHSHQIEDFIDENFSDLMRVVMLYYLLCEMAEWGGKKDGFIPSNIEAVLVPIKMRGSVWAVTMHASYRQHFSQSDETDVDERLFLDVPRWMSVFHICTTLKQKSSQLFDKTLWNNSQRRIARLVEKIFENLERIENYPDEIDKFNSLVNWEERYVPYGLPRILITKPNAAAIVGCEPIKIANEETTYQLYWQLQDNKYFVAAQKWSQISTRTFKSALEIGLRRGLAILKRKHFNDE